MKISQYLCIFCVACCAAAAPVKADLMTEFTKSCDRIEELISESSPHNTEVKDMAIFVFEKQLIKEITRKQNRIKGYSEEILYLEETIGEIQAGELDLYFHGDEETIEIEKIREINCRLADINEYQSAIADLEEEVAQYSVFLQKVQDWKNESN
ncbi:MAG TPA: hypothetical protein VGP47_06200 [Parachlamydiaceae bacterium]|nr:hypothetical protein [Parachlamydiaceae bacterium]